jgi:hypothetical protein
LLKKTHMLRCRSITSRQRTAAVRLRSSTLRAPSFWIFLSSLQEAFLHPN